MAMTGAEIYTYVLNKYKRTDKSTEVYEAITDIIENMKYRLRVDDYKEEATVTTGISAVGDYRIAVPNDFDTLLGGITVIDTDDDSEQWVMKQVSKDEYDEMFDDRLLSSSSNVYTDTPRYFCLYGGQFYLGPVPDKTTYKYSINYTTKSTTAVASGTTSVPFTSNYNERNVLRCGVLAELHDGEENYEEANYWRALYEVGLSEIENKNETKDRSDLSVTYRGI